MYKTCARCKGKRKLLCNGMQYEECPECNGTGKVKDIAIIPAIESKTVIKRKAAQKQYDADVIPVT